MDINAPKLCSKHRKEQEAEQGDPYISRTSRDGHSMEKQQELFKLSNKTSRSNMGTSNIKKSCSFFSKKAKKIKRFQPMRKHQDAKNVATPKLVTF